jgi:hypothetical protein
MLIFLNERKLVEVDTFLCNKLLSHETTVAMRMISNVSTASGERKETSSTGQESEMLCLTQDHFEHRTTTVETRQTHKAATAATYFEG